MATKKEKSPEILSGLVSWFDGQWHVLRLGMQKKTYTCGGLVVVNNLGFIL